MFYVYKYEDSMYISHIHVYGYGTALIIRKTWLAAFNSVFNWTVDIENMYFRAALDNIQFIFEVKYLQILKCFNFE